MKEKRREKRKRVQTIKEKEIKRTNPMRREFKNEERIKERRETKRR